MDGIDREAVAEGLDPDGPTLLEAQELVQLELDLPDEESSGAPGAPLSLPADTMRHMSDRARQRFAVVKHDGSEDYEAVLKGSALVLGDAHQVLTRCLKVACRLSSRRRHTGHFAATG